MTPNNPTPTARGEHMSGPWEVWRYDPEEGEWFVRINRRPFGNVCRVFNITCGWKDTGGPGGMVYAKETRANAHLIAAAPDMELLLRALRCGVAEFHRPTGELRFGGLMYSTTGEPCDWSDTLDIIGRAEIESAIARATGGAA